MAGEQKECATDSMPPLALLGRDLLCVSMARRVLTLVLPFAVMAIYAFFAWMGLWTLAILSVAVLCFVTYGSTSHDLVHRTLGLPARVNDCFLAVIELLSLRSGTAYRLSHLHHHKYLLADDDIEGSVAHGSLLKAIASGPTMQIRLWIWAWRNHSNARPRLSAEALGIFALIAVAVLLYPWTFGPLIYAAFVTAGSWLFPLLTVYVPHDANGASELAKTRLFRGWLFRVIAFDHLYHLEHHLYPAVPHHHWAILAVRLDPYLEGGRNRDIDGARLSAD